MGYEYYEDYEKQPSKSQKVKGLKATKTFDSITLTWNEIENAEGYVVQQVKNGKWKTVETIKSGAVTSFTIEGLLPAKKYKFRVRAYNYNGADKQYGKYSNKLTVKTSSVPAVGSLTASKVEKNTVTLTWSGNGVTNYESGYYVEQYKNSRWVRLAKVRDNYTYTVKKLKSGTTYRLRVKTYLVIDGKTYNGLTKTVTVKTK